MDDDTGSEETGSELRDDQTDTSSAEVPSARPRRAVTLRSSSEPERRLPAERTRRGRRAQAASCAEGGDKGPAASQRKDTAEVKRVGPGTGLSGQSVAKEMHYSSWPRFRVTCLNYYSQERLLQPGAKSRAKAW